MPAVEGTVRIEGLRELSRAFDRADKALVRELKTALREAGEPVRADAERLVVAQIPTVTLKWSRMRVGVTRHSVYVAPRARGARVPGRRRPRFAGKMLEPMTQALDRNVRETERRLDDMLGSVGRTWERG